MINIFVFVLVNVFKFCILGRFYEGLKVLVRKEINEFIVWVLCYVIVVRFIGG